MGAVWSCSGSLTALFNSETSISIQECKLRNVWGQSKRVSALLRCFRSSSCHPEDLATLAWTSVAPNHCNAQLV